MCAECTAWVKARETGKAKKLSMARPLTLGGILKGGRR